MCLSREMFYFDLLGSCMEHRGEINCLYHSTPIPESLVGSVWQRRHPRRLFWQDHVSRGRLKMIKWLLKKSIWATEVKKWHGMSHNDESDVFHTFSSSCSTWLGPHIFLGIFILFSEAFGRLTFSLRRHKVKELNYYIILLCHGDTQRELVKHSLDPPCDFIYFLLSGLPFLVGLSTLINYGYIDPCIVCWAHLNHWLEHLIF